MNNSPALVQIMARRRPGDKPLSEPMMVRLQTHICVTRPQWVKTASFLPLISQCIYYRNIVGDCAFILLYFPPQQNKSQLTFADYNNNKSRHVTVDEWKTIIRMAVLQMGANFYFKNMIRWYWHSNMLRYRPDAILPDQYLIDIDPRALAMWVKEDTAFQGYLVM